MTRTTLFRARSGRLTLTCAALALVGACTEPLDFDLRDLTNSFDTTAALAEVPNRPRPDDRGIISYPNYQVVVAQRDDTVRTIAGRIGVNADELARYNGINADTPLRRDEIIALPSRVAEPSPATGAVATGPIQAAPVVDVTTLASEAIDRAGPGPAVQTGQEPQRHQVAAGETGFTIARRYNVDVNALAEWNGLSGEMVVRQGQYLLIPPVGAAATSAVAAPANPPGSGSVAPVPPSAAAPLPQEVPEPAASPASPAASSPAASEAAPEPASVAPDLGSQQSAPPASTAAMIRPVSGSIIREYARGRNDGIDIAAPAGTAVKAAAAGTVAAITTDTAGIQIVVIRHDDGLLTVYTHVDDLTVARGASVSQGQTIGTVRDGDPSFMQFQVRRGTDSLDPADFLN